MKKQDKKKEYSYQYVWAEKISQPEGRKLGDLIGVCLEDKTEIKIITNKGKPTHCILRYPKKKFSKIFVDQINNTERDFIALEWDTTEIEAIFRGLNAALSKLKEGKLKNDNRQKPKD